MFGRQSDIMNDKSKKKSIIMALAVFIAIAAFASPLLMGDDNGDSNTVVLGEGETTLPDGWVEVADQNAIDSATESNLVLSSDFTGDLKVPTGKTLYGINLADAPETAGAPAGAKTISGQVTLEAGAALKYLNILNSGSNAVVIMDPTASEDETNAVDMDTYTVIQHCTISSIQVAVSYLDIQAGNITIDSNNISNDSTYAVLNFEGARDGVRDATATAEVFKLNITNNTISIGNDNIARAVSSNDKIGDAYNGGSEILITGNTISDNTTWSGSIAFRGLDENSKLTVTGNEITNAGSHLGFSGSSHLVGLTTDVKSLIVEGDVVLSEDFDSSMFEKITVKGVVSYDGSLISKIIMTAVDEETPIIKIGSLIINGELTPSSDEREPIVVSGDITLGGSLAGTLVILPAELDEAGNVLTKSNITLRNLGIMDDAAIEYKVTVDDESATDSGLISNISEIITNEAGEDVVVSNSYEDRGVTVDVSDLTYNSEYQDAPVRVIQYQDPNNNIKALTAIYYYAPGSSSPVIYNVTEYNTGINKNGISAGAEKVSGNILGFKDLKITNAGTYVLIYTVSTSEVVDDKSVVDENFEVTFNVHQKVITEIDKKQIIKIYDTNTDIQSILKSINIYKDDDVSFIAHFLSKDAGLWPVVIDGLDGNDAINYILSAKYDQSNYTTECVEGCDCLACNANSGHTCNDCEACICNYPLVGVILPKIITEDMIEVTKTYLSLDNNLIYPVITITLLDTDNEGNPVTVTLDTSKMNIISDRNNFNGLFISSSGDEYEFNQGIDYTDSLDWTAIITHLYAPEFDNYIVGPLVAGAKVVYSNSEDDCDLISNLLNSYHTLDPNNEPITDIIRNTMFMSYYLADDLDGNFTFVLYKGTIDDSKELYSEDMSNLKDGMRAWYFSFDDQAKDYLSEITVGDYFINIFAGNDLIGTFSFNIFDSNDNGNDDNSTLANSDGLVAYKFSINSDCESAAAWASKKAFDVTPGYVIKYHYIYDSNGSEIGEHQHITQIINPTLLKMGISYSVSNVGISPSDMYFNYWTTVDINGIYDDAAIPLDGQISFSINPLQIIDKDFLNKYVDKDTGVLNLYADYFVFTPVYPEEDKTIERVSNGFSSIVDEVKDYMAAYAVYPTDIDNNTAWIIYDQKGYTNSKMTGILYKIVDGERIEVFSEDLKSDNGRRSWYFSFDNQASSAVVDGDFSGLYMMNICADGETVLERTFEIYYLDYAVTVSADYAVNKETGAEGVRVSIEPKEGSIVPNGMVSVVYSYFEYDEEFGMEMAGTATSDTESVNESSTTQSLLIDTNGISSGHAIFEWTLEDGTTIYSLSNAVVPTK